MTKFQLRKDIVALLRARSISLHKFAQETGVDSASLWRFMNRVDANLNTDNLFKLWPHIYGEQTPIPLPEWGKSGDMPDASVPCVKS